MPLPRCPAGAVEINRGVRPPEYATPHPALSCTPAGCRPPLSLSVFSPPPSPAPLRGAGERRYTLTNQGLHPRLSASRPCGACPLLLLRLCSGQALRKGGPAFQTAPCPSGDSQSSSSTVSGGASCSGVEKGLSRNLFASSRGYLG